MLQKRSGFFNGVCESSFGFYEGANLVSSEDDILCCCFVLAFLCFELVRFFLLNEYKYLSVVVFFFSIAGDL